MRRTLGSLLLLSICAFNFGSEAIADGYAVRNAIVANARAQDGKPYVWGATGPDAFDCSGLVLYCYNLSGVGLDQRTAAQQWSACDQLGGVGDLLPGDLVFYGDLSHVGIWTGSNSVFAADSPYFGIHEHYWGWDSGYTLFGRLPGSYWPGGDNGYNACSSPGNLRWTNLNGLQPGVWYRTGGGTRLEYAVDGGTDPVYCQEFAGTHSPTYQTRGGHIELSWGGLGMKQFRVESWSGCNDQRIGINSPISIGWDDEAPSVSITSGPNTGTWYRSTQRVNWHVTDGDNRSGVRGFGQSWVSDPPFQFNAADGWLDVPEGVHTLYVHAWDNANNGGGDPGNNRDYTFGPYQVDSHPPTITLTEPTRSHWYNRADGAKSMSWSATDGTSGMGSTTLQWDSGTPGGVQSSGSAQIAEGKHTAIVRATDNAGNSSSQSGGPWWIDTTSPVISTSVNPVIANGENGWYISYPTISFTATDPNGADGSGVGGTYCTLDGVETPYTSGVTISDNGVHTISARATDIAGNSGWTGDLIVKLDTTAPVFDTVYTDAESRSLDTLVAAWSCADPDSGIAEYEYWIGTTAGDNDVQPATTTGNNWAYAMNLSLTSGQTYYFTVRAMNAAGLWNTTVCSQGIQAQPDWDTSPTMNAGGVSVPVEARASTNYKIVDSIGQFVVDGSSSANYVMEHGYWHSDISFVQVASAGAAKAYPNGVKLQIGTAENPLVVSSSTSTFAGRFYVEQSDRASGIAVQYGAAGGPTLVEGDQVTVIGKVDTIGGERIVTFASPQWIGHTDPVKPVFIIVPSLGGCNVNEYTLGVLDGRGLNNIGLLVTTFGGLVSYRDPQGRFFYVDNGDNLYDGSHFGVRVICDGFQGGGKLAMPAYGKSVMVTGISSTTVISGHTVRAIRPRTQLDIVAW